MARTDCVAALVRVDALRQFCELASRLGGRPKALLAKSRVKAAILDDRNAVIPYRTMVQLLERAAAELGCPDFGMRLAVAQSRTRVLGPLEVVIRNSRSVREAFQYCAEHPYAYGQTSHIRLEAGRPDGTAFLRFEVLVPKLPSHPQSLERALLLTQRIALNISGGQIRAREVWLTHEPISPLPVYQEHFGAPVRFAQPANGLVFIEHELDTPVSDADPQLYELATTFIEDRFTPRVSILSMRVRAMIERLLLAGDCSHGTVAAALGMHPRTLQRRLRTEGDSFEALKDGVRLDLARRHLKDPSIPLIRIATMLGYSGTSALSKSCQRWFAASPRELRSAAGTAAAFRARATSAMRSD